MPPSAWSDRSQSHCVHSRSQTNYSWLETSLKKQFWGPPLAKILFLPLQSMQQAGLAQFKWWMGTEDEHQVPALPGGASFSSHQAAVMTFLSLGSFPTSCAGGGFMQQSWVELLIKVQRNRVLLRGLGLHLSQLCIIRRLFLNPFSMIAQVFGSKL